MKKTKFSFSIPRIKLPSLARLGGLRIPLPNGLYLGGGKLIVGGFGTVVIGFVASTFILMESGTPDIAYPQAGAVYTVPERIGEPVLGYRDMGDISADRNQTLQINIPGGSRISDMIFF